MGGEGTNVDEIVGWHHRLNGHALEQAPGVGDGQGKGEMYNTFEDKIGSPVSSSPFGTQRGIPFLGCPHIMIGFKHIKAN